MMHLWLLYACSQLTMVNLPGLQMLKCRGLRRAFRDHEIEGRHLPAAAAPEMYQGAAPAALLQLGGGLEIRCVAKA